MARLWNFLNNDQDDFWPISTWPLHLQMDMLRAHKNSFMRYNLFKFLNGNGVDPTKAVQMIYIQDVVKGVPYPGDYDAVALREFQGMIDKAKARHHVFYRDMKYWDMHNKKKME